MASILPFLARYAASGAAGLLAGQDQRRQRLVAETLQRQQLDRQARLDAAAEADRQQRNTLAAANAAANGVFLGVAPTVEVPRMLGGPLGPVVDRLPTPENDPERYTQLPGAYIDNTKTQDARAERAADRQERYRAAAQAAIAARQQAALEAQNARAAADLGERRDYHRTIANRPPRPSAGQNPIVQRTMLERERRQFVARRITALTTPKRDRDGDLIPGSALDLAGAQAQAEREWETVTAGDGTPPENAPATPSAGPVDLRQPGQPPHHVGSDDPSTDLYQRAAAAYKAAVASGTPEAEARARYDRIVAAIAAKGRAP